MEDLHIRAEHERLSGAVVEGAGALSLSDVKVVSWNDVLDYLEGGPNRSSVGSCGACGGCSGDSGGGPHVDHTAQLKEQASSAASKPF